MPSSELILNCSCSKLGHSVRFSYWDDGDAFIEVSLDYGYSFWRRFVTAWRYLFSSTCGFGDASEVILKQEDYPMLRKWIDEAEALEAARLAKPAH